MRFMRDQFAHFSNGNRRQSSNKEEKQRYEKSHRANERAVIPERGLVTAPCARIEIARQADDDDDKTLQPHAEVDHQRHNKQRRNASAYFTNPQQLRREDVAQNQGEIVAAVWTVQSLVNQEHVK